MLLVEAFVSHQQPSPGAAPLPTAAAEASAALRGLLAYSAPAKAMAVQLGLHASLLASCVSLAEAALAGGTQHNAPVPPAARSSKLSKLRSLRQQQAAAAAPPRPRSGVSGGKGSSRKERGGSTCESQNERSAAGAAGVAGCPEGAAVGPAEQPTSEGLAPQQGDVTQRSAQQQQHQQQQQQQQLLLFLDILKHLAFESEAAR